MKDNPSILYAFLIAAAFVCGNYIGEMQVSSSGMRLVDLATGILAIMAIVKIVLWFKDYKND